MQFDPQSFLDAETTTKSERRPPLPVGDYLAVIGEVSTKPGQKDDRAWVQVIIPLSIQVPPNIKQELGYTTDTLTLTDRPFLDLTESGTIDWGPGRNRAIRAYREATDQNVAGESFSLRRLQGRPVKVKVTHELYNNETQERIGGVTKP